MDPVCFTAFAGQRAAAPRLPVAWLEGDILAEYLLFLEETVSPPPKRVPMAWLEWEARHEFLRFLDESRAAAAAADPERQQEEHGRAARDGGGDADDRGLVVDDGGFMDDDDGVGSMEEEEEGEDGGACMEKDEQDAEAALELLLPHILDLPTFRARAAAPQEPAPGSPRYQSGWLQLGVCHIEMDSGSSSSSSDEEMSSEEEIEQDASLCDHQLVADSSFRH